MLTYLDGMKWNCLAQRYLYTSNRGFKVIYKPTLHFKIIDLTSTPFKIMFVPPFQAISVMWQLCLLRL